MAAITGMGTTYTLPNYTGILYGLTPTETPFFSAIGGLAGGGQTTSTQFEWQTYDMRNANQKGVVALEGANAPTAQNRVRGNATNVTEIHQETVSVSYTKLAAFGQKAGLNIAADNPIVNELDWQTQIMLKQMARDIEFSFLLGAYNLPSDNTTTRQTRGLLAAIQTNLQNVATTAASASLSASGSTITETSTTRANGDVIVFTDNGGSALVQGARYYVINKATNTFQVATTAGGSAVTIGTATVVYSVPRTTDLTVDDLNGLLQLAYDNGGVSDSNTATLLVNSCQKRQITKAAMSAYGKYYEQSRTVGGVSVDTLVTDFGVLNVMMSRFIPQDAIVACSMEHCQPVFLEVPGKGHFFAEPLAKTGASDQVMLYGETGLAYGNERTHALLRGLKVA
jgi:hypothetical protein